VRELFRRSVSKFLYKTVSDQLSDSRRFKFWQEFCATQKKYLLANEIHRLREVADDLVLFFVHVLALGVNPPAALGTLDHPGVVVVVVVAALAERTEAAFLLLQAAGRTERLADSGRLVGEFGRHITVERNVGHVGSAARVAPQTRFTALKNIQEM